MKKILTLTSLATIATIGAAHLYAQNLGGMIDSFKTRQEKILFESLPFTATGANEVLEYEYRINGLEGLKKRLAETTEFYTEKKQETTSQRLTLEAAIAALDKSIAETEKNISDTREKVMAKQQKIQTLELASLELKKKIASHRQIILDYLANMYSEGNLIFDESGSVDIMKALLLTNEDTDYYLRDITYKAIVSQLGQQFIDEYRSLVREYYTTSVRTQEEKGTLEQLQSYLEKQNATYNAQKQEREHLLEITKGQEALYQQHIESQRQAQAQVEDAWKKANEDQQKSMENFLAQYNCTENMTSADCERLRQFFANEAELSQSEHKENTDNIFTWPSASRRITAYFRDPSYYKAVGAQHDAIDIGTPQGSDVIAPADGYVYYINPPSSPAAYSFLVMKHKGGIVTVYGHLSEIVAKPYQYVRQGEVIAKSGGAPGTPGAGPATSGPHLHFEVWKNKEPVDPLRFITLADIDYKVLPARYQTKFIADIAERSGSGSTDTSGYKVRFTLRGDTEEERQKYLLNTYATNTFKNRETWTDTALAANIDPSFMMCIGLSETTLGNYLKTPYNVGNVGNTDNGSTITFGSAQEGISAMARTFNNKYLGGYNKLSQLSRWGNSSGPIYASSSSEWHDNTIRCLTALKGRFVEDDFNFRVKTQK